ncbi:MAG TPA: hypothetical protein VIL74_13675 [Pyrinomonadaceae bacterium]|jgi:hypothetical protein
MLVVFLFFFFLAFFLVGGFALKIIVDSVKRKGELGVNLRPVICPRCGVKAELFRTPDLISKPTWGGGACSNCGCEMDKWGNEIAENKEVPHQLEPSKTHPFTTFDEQGKTPLERVFDEK